jgi:thiol-disulfide isomerase/thioredoxin
MVTLQAAMMAMLLSSPGQIELLDFYSDTCAPCRAMQPTIQALEAKGYPVKKVNISHNRELTAQYRVDSVPCYILLVDGKEVERLSGGTSYSRLEKMFKTAAAKAGTPANASPSSNNMASSNVLNNLPSGLPPTFASNENGARNPPAPGGIVSIPPANAVFDPNVLPASAVMPMAAAQANPVNANVSDAQLIAASVRIRVEDPSGTSCGSGTIIDARGGRALVLTCGHVFRDSKGKGKIEIELFGPHAGQKVEGRLESYDSEVRDVGLVSIQMSDPIVAARLAPVGYTVRRGDAVASVGCDHGADPTVRRNKVNSADTTNLWVADQPTEGRSGGGLFSAEGYVIGLCNGCDPQDREGLYAPLGRICTQLDQTGLSMVYQSPQGWEKMAEGNPSILLASHNVPSMPSEMSGIKSAMNTPAVNPSSNFPANPSPLMANSSSLNPSEQAAMDEIHRHLKDGSEVVCVIRPRNSAGARSEVIMLDKASPELVRQLTAEAQGKDSVQRTSLDVARPRKKLLEWSLNENTPQTAP